MLPERVDMVKMTQLVLDIELEPVHNGMFWGCCLHRNKQHSLVWLPPDQKSGRCNYCGREYTFISAHGREEGA